MLAERTLNLGTAVVGWVALAFIGGCSDSSGPCLSCSLPSQGLIVSHPVPLAGAAARTGAQGLAAGAGDSVVYVSLTTGSVPAGASAAIRRVGDEPRAITAVLDGGFNPVVVPARVGDSVEVVVRDAGGGVVTQMRIGVAATRPPVVVRTEPPHGKRDQPLNASLVVVFSEPVDGASTTPTSIRLLGGSNAVSGAVRFLDPSLDASHVSVEFVPDSPLAPHTQYQLVVTRQVRDLSGDPLAAADTAEFTTGASSTGPPASIRASPDSSLFLVAGETYQLTAVVRDVGGNEITDQPVTWASNRDSVVTVSPTGRVTALIDGWAAVTASVGGVSKPVFVFVAPNPAASITIAPNPTTVAASDTLILAAMVRDAAGRVINNPFPYVEWTSSDPTVATATAYGYGAGTVLGKVTGVSPGSVTVTATSGTARGTTVVTVSPRPVASVTIVPDSATVVVGGAAKLRATLRDSSGRIISGRPITWSSDNATVATVDTSGIVRGATLGSAKVIAAREGVSDTVAITVRTISLATVSAGGRHTCGLTSDGAAYCWGDNFFGQLGFGAFQGPDDCGNGFVEPCSTAPVAVVGGLKFSYVAAGFDDACGLTETGAVYCWGQRQQDWRPFNTSESDSVPVAVSGGLTFSAVSVGLASTCGLTTGGAAYCWGSNGPGLLGDGSGVESHVPVAVSGGLTFSLLSVGWYHACGVTTGGAAYCWGGNNYGQLGVGDSSARSVPVPVAGGLTFTSVSAGQSHTCGVTTGGAAYCWGWNFSGQLGNGSAGFTITAPVPVPVAGGLTFAAVSAGESHTCGITISGAAYCWGGSTNADWVPVAVAGGFTFSSLSAGATHNCSLSAGGTAYCWGDGGVGQLGNGSTTGSSVPVKVKGQP